jgi:hypothetical protein
MEIELAQLRRRIDAVSRPLRSEKQRRHTGRCRAVGHRASPDVISPFDPADGARVA